MPFPTPARSVPELITSLEDSCRIDGTTLRITDEASFRDEGVRTAVWTATFSEDADTVAVARWVIWQAAAIQILHRL